MSDQDLDFSLPDRVLQPREFERRVFVETETRGLRERCPFFAEHALDELRGVGEREALLHLLKGMKLPPEVDMPDLHAAFWRVNAKSFDLSQLDDRLADHWRGYASTVGRLVTDPARHVWVRKWFYIALALAEVQLARLH